jgi:hypothetical protein
MLLEDGARLADAVENVEPLAPRRDLSQPDDQSNCFEFLERPNVGTTWCNHEIRNHFPGLRAGLSLRQRQRFRTAQPSRHWQRPRTLRER